MRPANEDSLLARGDLELWAVADGMGGHANGRFASNALAEALGEVRASGDFDQDTARVADAIHAANATVHAAAAQAGKTMGSTVVALLIRGVRFAVFWAGDSRAYLHRNGALVRLTSDHTQVQEMVDQGYLSPEEAVSHPMSHVLSRAVGVEGELRLDAIADAAACDDVFLLCSDGLYGVVSDAEIASALATHTPADASQGLVELCLSRGAPDNVTVVVVKCQEPTLLRLSA